MPSIISLSDIPRSKFDRLKKSFFCQNKELEKHIRQYAFNHQLAVAQQKKLGCRALIVDSKPEAIEFYKRFNFVEINKEENNETMFMVCDIAKPNEVKNIVDDMIEFCEVFKQNDLIEILKK